MTKRDLFRVTLKLAGLYFIVTLLFNSLPSLIFFATNTGGNPTTGLLTSLFGVLIFVLIFVVLVFKPDVIINIFKLDKNFDDDMVMIKRPSFENMLQWGIIILSLSVLLKHLPALITNLIFAFKVYVIDSGNDFLNPLQQSMFSNYMDWGVKITAVIIAILMLTNSRAITNYITKKNTINKIEE